MGVISEPQPEHGVDVDHEGLARPDLPSGRGRAGAEGVSRAVPARDLVSAGEGPLPLASRLPHGVRGDAGDLRLRHPAIAPVPERLEDGLVAHVHDPGGLPEAVDGSLVLDHGESVDERVGVDEFGSRKRRAEPLVLVVGQVAFGKVVGHSVFDSQLPRPPAQQLADVLGDLVDLVHAAEGSEAANALRIEPGIVAHPSGVDREGEDHRQPLARNHHEGPPGAEGVDRPGESPQPRSQVDVEALPLHLRLDGPDASREVDEVGVPIGLLRRHGRFPPMSNACLLRARMLARGGEPAPLPSCPAGIGV